VILCNLLFNLLIMFYLLLKEKNLTNYKKYKKNKFFLNLKVNLSINFFFFLLLFLYLSFQMKIQNHSPTFQLSIFLFFKKNTKKKKKIFY